MSKKYIALAAMIAAAGVQTFVAMSVLAADQPASAPAVVATPVGAAKVEAQKMRIVVVEVKGIVQIRSDEKQPWTLAKVGMEVSQGAEFRTGPRSSVTCQIPPDQLIVLDRLGTLKIDEAIRTGKKVKTDMIMKYGRTKYDIEGAGAEHESTIRSPDATLAVRGTAVSLYDQPPFTPVAESYHGRAFFRNAERELRFGGKTFTQIANDKKSVADTALGKSVVDPASSSTRTRSEARYVADQTSKSAVFSFDTFANIAVIRDGPAPPTDAQLLASVPTLPGTLDIVLRWQGNANINLVVGDQAGTNPIALLSNFKPTEFLYPGFGLNHSPAGGIIPYDNQGGPNGGMEIAYWKGSYPMGLYGISAVHQSGGPALVTFDVFQNGKQLDNLTTVPVDSQGHVLDLTAPGVPPAVRNNQITRPLSPTFKPSANDLMFIGPDAGRITSITAFIPPQPSFDDQTPVETPVTFPPPGSGKGGKEKSSGTVRSVATTSLPTSTVSVTAPLSTATNSANSRQATRSR